jgi:hypothetical protein
LLTPLTPSAGTPGEPEDVAASWFATAANGYWAGGDPGSDLRNPMPVDTLELPALQGMAEPRREVSPGLFLVSRSLFGVVDVPGRSAHATLLQGGLACFGVRRNREELIGLRPLRHRQESVREN